MQNHHVTLPGSRPKGLKAGSRRETGTPMFTQHHSVARGESSPVSIDGCTGKQNEGEKDTYVIQP